MDIAVPVRVLRLCRVVRTAGVALLAIVLAAYALPTFAPGLSLWNQHWAHVAAVGGLPVAWIAALGTGDRLLLAAVALPYLACLIWAFVHLHRMLRGFERGDFFAASTIRHLRAFAGLILLARILAMAAGHLRVAIAASLHESLTTHPVLNITSDELALVMLCTLIFLIAHMLEKGGRLEDENRSFL
jgi:hypothetical protein